MRIIKPDNTQDKMPDKVKSKPKVNSELEASFSLGEASPSPDNITPDPDMGIDLESES